jgi:hypothetical protein
MVSWFRGQKALQGICRQASPGSFDCAPQGPVLCDTSVRRFAQDDGFAVGLKYIWLGWESVLAGDGEPAGEIEGQIFCNALLRPNIF